MRGPSGAMKVPDERGLFRLGNSVRGGWWWCFWWRLSRKGRQLNPRYTTCTSTYIQYMNALKNLCDYEVSFTIHGGRAYSFFFTKPPKFTVKLGKISQAQPEQVHDRSLLCSTTHSSHSFPLIHYPFDPPREATFCACPRIRRWALAKAWFRPVEGRFFG